MDGELPVFIASYNGVSYLCIFADVSGVGEDPRDVRANAHALGDGGGVRVTCELGRVIVHICGDNSQG